MRLDVRLKKPIKAYILTEEIERKKVILEGLSLSGCVLKGNISLKKNIIEILISYKSTELRIPAKKIRKDKEGFAIKFLITKKIIRSSSNVKSDIPLCIF